MGTNENFISARQFAKLGVKSEAAIRREIRLGLVPGFRSGNKFVINRDMYMSRIEEECRRNAEGRREESKRNRKEHKYV